MCPFKPKIFLRFIQLLWSLRKSRKENPQKLTQLSSRSHPRHLVGKRIALRLNMFSEMGTISPYTLFLQRRITFVIPGLQNRNS